MKKLDKRSTPRRPVAREHLRLTPLMLSLVCLGVTPALAQTLPTGFAAVAGGVTASQSGAAMTVNQTTQRAIAQWQTFSIGAGGSVNVAQPSSSSILLNRVVGNELSTIAGSLRANGHVFLLNPNGVLFAPGSSVNVGGIVATTMKMSTSDADFMGGARQLSFEAIAGNNATVVNQGSITAANGGTVALMGSQAINNGSINVAQGSAGLVSAGKVTVDFDGDGLTRFIIPADSQATNALVQNTGSVTADGGRIAMLAASDAKAQVVNQSGVLRARSLESRNGEIVLGAGQGTAVTNGNTMSITGTLDASGGATSNGGTVTATAGRMSMTGATIDASGRNGGQVNTSANYLAVDGTTTVVANGSGQPQTTDGRWTVNSSQDITISNNPPFFSSNSSAPQAPVDGGSIINSAALSRTLSNSTNVTLGSHGERTSVDPVEGYSAGLGVRFDNDAQVVKTAGRDVDFIVNSQRGILMYPGSTLASSSGALNIDFNADSAGAPLPANLAITVNGDGPLGGPIAMSQASIESNGGRIRFYGQSDPVNGRAVGGMQNDGSFAQPGVLMMNSLVSTCAQGQEACSGAGDISMRGQGATGTNDGTILVNGGAGLGVYGSTVRSGAGAITLDGRGGLGASGVRSQQFGQAGQTSVIESGSGDIRITGSSRDAVVGDPAVAFQSDDGFVDNFGGGGGVTLAATRVTTGGGITIDGTGGNFDALVNNAQFQSNVIGAATGSSANVLASNGVVLFQSDLTAGTGRQISVTGKAGSNGFTVALTPTETIEVTPNTEQAYGVGVIGNFRQGAVTAEGGRIALVGRDNSDVSVSYTDDSEGGPLDMLNVASATGRGGTIDITGRNILVTNDFNGETNATYFNADGNTGGGTISVRSSGAIAIDAYSGMAADATGASGNGGNINVIADGDLRAHNSYSANAGAQGGNGGFVETSGKSADLAGARVTASAPVGAAGMWTIDPANITIAPGAAASVNTLPSNPFEPLADSTVLDGDINATLGGGTGVTIVARSSGPNSGDGNIFFQGGPTITPDKSGASASFVLNADRSITGGATIQGNSAPLNVEFNAGRDASSGSIVFNGTIATQGGSVTMTALGNGFQSCAICLSNTLIDTRGATGDGGVSLSVPSPGTQPTGFAQAAIYLNNTDISSGAGNVNLSAFATSGTGVWIDGSISAGEGRLGIISTTTGNISVTGVGGFASNSALPPGQGVVIDNARLTSDSGSITVRGVRRTGTTAGTGVTITNASELITTGAGDIEVTGESVGAGTGLLLQGATNNGQGVLVPASTISSGRNVVLRASNDGSTDAIVINGTASAGQVLDLRPGGVNVTTGAGEDRTANPISLLGGTGAGGYAISADEMGRFTAATVVVGSNTHAADIDVLAPMTSAVPLTLQNGGGGNINLGSPISAPTLGLISGGNITQAAGAGITAGTLLAQSTGGNVILSDASNNVSASTLGGGAAGRFEFVNSGPLRVGPVSVTTYDAAGNLPQVQTATSMAADTVLVRTLAGSLTLDTNVSSTSGADLVAATTFQNAGGGSMSGAPWRIWADTWVGEARGGLVGSGQLPNLYHCAYLGLCTVTVSPGDNHFIYAQQPSLTVAIGSFSRNAGEPNPLFTYVLTGLILGDRGAGVSGTTSTEASLQSPAGRYPIFGTFASAEGYLVNVVPGELVVGNVLPKPAQFVDVLREEPTTYLYDRNIGQAPICLATGPLDGDRATQGNDVLAREWSRVRTRPNLTSCLDTERTSGCADF